MQPKRNGMAWCGRGVLVASALTSVMALSLGSAFAQSTGTQAVEEILVTADKRDEAIGGLIVPETKAKSRSSVDSVYIATQASGQSIAQSLNLLPGINFTNNDPYGSSGGNIRLRSFDGNRIALLLDGMPLNDTGNYAIFTNQQLDPELIERTVVNLGTTDVDAPTAAATGGTVNIVSKKPGQELGLQFAGSVGTDDYKRFFLLGETGAFGPWGTTGYGAGSYQKYDKFRGPGQLEKKQFNAKLYQDFGGGDFVSVAFHFNRNRNNSYRGISDAEIALFGFRFDNFATCTRAPARAGLADNDGSTAAGAGAFGSTGNNLANPASCSNYFELRVNPSDTGNLRAQSAFHITDNLRVTFDPSFQYVLANGGGTNVLSETDTRLRGNGGPGRDLNGDGDLLDSVRLYTPNNTNTRRWGANTSLVWTPWQGQIFQLAYTFDYGIHRQTGQMSLIDQGGNPDNVFGGLKGTGILASDGSGADLRLRDRRSIAMLNQVSFGYAGTFFNDVVHIDLGVRAPFFDRRLNQFCYTAITGAGAGLFPGSAQGQVCTTQAVTSLANGNVSFGNGGAPAEFLRPFTGKRKYNRILPNAGVSFKPFGEEHFFFASYAEGLAVPRTDNLYSAQILNPAPERTTTFDMGYRFQASWLLASVAYWRSQFENRIVTSFDPDLNLNVDRNVGDVKLWGIDAEIGFSPAPGLSVYGSAAYIDTEVQNDIRISATTTVPTKGKRLVETPDWTAGLRIQYETGPFLLGFQGKFVGDRFATDVNDVVASDYTVFDANLRYSLSGFGFEGSYLQLNAINLFDTNYRGSISSTQFSSTSGTVLYQIGAPRTVQLTLNAAF